MSKIELYVYIKMSFSYTPKNICKYYKQMYTHYFDNIEPFFEKSIDPLENVYNTDLYEHIPGKNGVWAMLLAEMEMYQKLLNMEEFDGDLDLYRLDYDDSETKEYIEFFDKNFNLLYNIKEKNYYRKEYNNIIKKQGAEYFLELLNEHIYENGHVPKQDFSINKKEDVKLLDKNNTQQEINNTFSNEEYIVEDVSSSEKDDPNNDISNKNEEKNDVIIEDKNIYDKCPDNVTENNKIKEKKINKIRRTPKTFLEIAISKIDNINFEKENDIKIDETNIFYNVISHENKYLYNNYELIVEYKNLYHEIKKIKTDIILNNSGIEKKRNKLHQLLINTLSNTYNINDSNISRYMEKSERCSIYYEALGKNNVKNCIISPRFLIELRKKDFEKLIKYINDKFNGNCNIEYNS